MQANVSIPIPGDGVSGFINIAASQGSRTSLVSQAPSITLANGLPGGIFDTSQTPFVAGVIPVVNDASLTPLAGAPAHQSRRAIPGALRILDNNSRSRAAP